MAFLYTAKFNINEKIYQVKDNKEDLNDLLDKVYLKINQDEIIFDENDENIRYKFVDLFRNSEMTLDGTIVKIYDGVNSSYDESNDTVVDEEASDKADYVSFSFDVKNEIIGFVPKQTFSREAFLKYFRLLVEKCVPELGSTYLILLNDKGELDEKFKRMETLRDIEILLIPENSDKEDFAKLLDIVEEDMQEANAQKIGLRMEGTMREPLKKNSRLVENFKSSVARAYAKLKAKGKDENGEVFEIDTSKDTLLKREIKNDLRNSVTDISEKTREAVAIYKQQRVREVIEDERK